MSHRTDLVTRRGVSSVLAMMFLVIFGSLAAAMAVVAQGNLRTADSHMRVNRAMSAAETGLVFAQRRLHNVATRFVTTVGVITDDYGETLWDGPLPGDGSVIVMPPNGFTESQPPDSVGEALLNAHLADSHTVVVESGDSILPNFFGGTDILKTRPIALTADEDGTPNPKGPHFRLRYEIVSIPNVSAFVRVVSRGIDGDVTRTLTMDFVMDKKIEFAIISPSRIMIGKNVRVEGPLGSRFGIAPGELDSQNGDPLVMRSDFFYLDDQLDAMLSDFYTQVAEHDVDGDGRLRIYHPDEALGLSGDSYSFSDWDGNEYVDDLDLFLTRFDQGGTDNSVIYDSFLAGGGTVEFDGDLQLCHLIDTANPDRNGDGIAGDSLDELYGYLDGKISAEDGYAKVHGRLAFAVTRSEWDLANGDSYQTVVQGPITADIDEAPVTFEASDDELRELTSDMFTTTGSWYEGQVGSVANFAAQVSSATPAFNHTPEFVPGGAGTNWERIPYEAPGAYDYYDRPIYRGYRFENARIPIGTNALFEDCLFVGVTWIDTEEDCIHENWNYLGALVLVDEGPPQVFEEKYPGIPCELDGNPITSTKDLSNNIRFHNSTFVGTLSGHRPNEYTHWRNKVQFTGNTRWFIYEDDPELVALLDAGDDEAADIKDEIVAMNPANLVELRKSSILLPGWSVDIGNFTGDTSGAPTSLKGACVGGIIDARGHVVVDGIFMTTQRSEEGVGPLYYGGLPDAFNTTIGYFGPADGDGEGMDVDDPDFPGFGEILLRWNPDSDLPDGIPWKISIDAEPLTYWEGGEI